MEDNSINKLAEAAYKNAVDKGFYENKAFNLAEKLLLIHSEVSEALEADRRGSYIRRVVVIELLQIKDDKDFEEAFKVQAKDTFGDELADIMIRVMDLATHKGIDLESYIQAKMRYNSLRPYKHNKKY